MLPFSQRRKDASSFRLGPGKGEMLTLPSPSPSFQHLPLTPAKAEAATVLGAGRLHFPSQSPTPEAHCLAHLTRPEGQAWAFHSQKQHQRSQQEEPESHLAFSLGNLGQLLIFQRVSRPLEILLLLSRRWGGRSSLFLPLLSPPYPQGQEAVER